MDPIAWTSLAGFTLALIALAYWRLSRRPREVVYEWELLEEAAATRRITRGGGSCGGQRPNQQVIAHDKERF